MIRKHWKIITVVSVLILTIAGSCFYTYHFIPRGRGAMVADSIQVPREVIQLYGLPVDSFDIQFDEVRPNQMLLSILSEYNLPEGAIARLVGSGNPAFDLRKIRAGNKYALFFNNDSLHTLRYLVYEHTPIDYVLFAMADSMPIRMGQKEVTTIQRRATGSIRSSLWNAMVEGGANPVMANELSEIYAWTIDFFGLQPADSFCVVYDEQYVDTLAVGLGQIYGAYFRNGGTEYYAIPFEQDSIVSFYDLEGQSLRKAFLKAPLRFSRVSSHFSNSRMHPVLKIRRPHHGVDYAAPAGTPVQSIGDGKVIEASHGYNRGGGNFVKIKHNGVYSTAYLHLKGFAKGIQTGAHVKQGDVIGYVGATGLATGAHLDFRFYMNGKPIDPLKVEAPPVEPVHEANRAAFDSVKTRVIQLLQTVN